MTSTNKKKIALLEKYNQEKLRNHAMKNGVILKSPETVFLSSDTKYGKNVIINPYVVIGRKTKIGKRKLETINKNQCGVADICPRVHHLIPIGDRVCPPHIFY